LKTNQIQNKFKQKSTLFYLFSTRQKQITVFLLHFSPSLCFLSSKETNKSPNVWCLSLKLPLPSSMPPLFRFLFNPQSLYYIQLSSLSVFGFLFVSFFSLDGR